MAHTGALLREARQFAQQQRSAARAAFTRK